MDIILLQDVDKVGDKYQTVKVKDGFGNNFLIPKGLALVANDSNRRKYAAINRALDKKDAARLGEYQAIAAQLNGKTVKIVAKAGASGKLFGSVDAAQIAAAITEQLGVAIERKKVSVEPLKELGTHVAAINLHKEVSASVTVEIVSADAPVAVAEAPAPVVVEAPVVEEVAAVVEAPAPVVVEAPAVEEVAAVVEAPAVEEVAAVVETPAVEEVAVVEASDAVAEEVATEA
jgi:large subunit ribosomal protein L9